MGLFSEMLGDFLGGGFPRPAPALYRVRAALRARRYAAGAPVRIPCLLDASSPDGTFAERVRGRLAVQAGAGAPVFTPLRRGAAVAVPLGGGIGQVSGAQPSLAAPRVKRAMTCYRAPEGAEFWLETTEFDLALLHRVLRSSAAGRPGAQETGLESPQTPSNSSR